MTDAAPTTLDLASEAWTTTSTAAPIRSRRPDESILPADDWCPIYVYYHGTSAAKFTDSQIEGIARAGVERGWCNLCDAPQTDDKEAHVKQHMRDLRAWRKRRGAVIDKERTARLAEARRERKREKDAEAIAESGIAKPRTRSGRGR